LIQLSTYFRSTAAYRVRIALELKGLEHELVPVNLLEREHRTEAYLANNPEGLVPCLSIDDVHLSQSMAILEYLEETFPEPALLPDSAVDRAYVRALAQTVICDIHPLNNLRVLRYLKHDLKTTEQQKLDWYHHWLKAGFDSLEVRLDTSPHTGNYCFGNTPGLADICLVPQVYNAKRFEFDLSPYPTIRRINNFCLENDSFDQARPERQTDAPD